jgi:transcriptional regulator with XRE-family HTH domain
MSPQSDAALKLRASLADAFARVLYQARTGAGLSRLKLGTEADIDPSYIEQMEKARAAPSLPILFALAWALELEPDELVRRALSQLKKPTGPALPPSRRYRAKRAGRNRVEAARSDLD